MAAQLKSSEDRTEKEHNLMKRFDLWNEKLQKFPYKILIKNINVPYKAQNYYTETSTLRDESLNTS